MKWKQVVQHINIRLLVQKDWEILVLNGYNGLPCSLAKRATMCRREMHRVTLVY